MGVLTTWALALTLVASAEPAADEGAWAVVGLAGSGVWATDVERVEDGVRQALARAKVGRVQPRAATAALLTEARQAGLVCDVHEPACAAKLGVSAGVDRVLLLEVSSAAGLLRLDLVSIDVAREVIAARAQRDVDGASPDASALDDAVLELHAPQRFFGQVIVDNAPAGAAILVDGTERGRAPLSAPIARVTPGRHVIEVKASDASFSAPIDVQRGGLTRVEAVFPARTGASSVAMSGDAGGPTTSAPGVADVVGTADAGLGVGLPLAIGGGAALVIGAVGAGGLAALLETPLEANTRQGVRAAGVALLGLAVVGVVVGVTGAGLWFTEDGA